MMNEIQESEVPHAATQIDPGALIAFVVECYHGTHRGELPPLIDLAHKVERVHQGAPEVPAGLAVLLEQLSTDLEKSMHFEEAVLFPAIQNGLSSYIAELLSVLIKDSNKHRENIARIEALTDHFSAPDNACGSWLRLYAGVQKLCTNLREHIDVEHDFLFSRLETATVPSGGCSHV